MRACKNETLLVGRGVVNRVGRSAARLLLSTGGVLGAAGGLPGAAMAQNQPPLFRYTDLEFLVESTSLVNEQASSFLRGPDGTVYVAGTFGLRRWTGAEFEAIALPGTQSIFIPYVQRLRLIDGVIYAASGLDNFGGQVYLVRPGVEPMRLRVSLDSTSSVFDVSKLADGRFVVGGERLGQSSGDFDQAVMVWENETWLPLGAGLRGVANELAMTPEGELIAFGRFTRIGDQDITSQPSIVAKWNGTQWVNLSSSLPPLANNASQAYSGVIRADGTIVVGGSFRTAAGPEIRNIAKFDGAHWQGFGGSVGASNPRPSTITHIAERSRGRVLALGSGLLPVDGGVDALVSEATETTSLALLRLLDVFPFDASSRTYIRRAFEDPEFGVVIAGNFAQVRNVNATDLAALQEGTWTRLGSQIVHSPSINLPARGASGRVLALERTSPGFPFQMGLLRLGAIGWERFGPPTPTITGEAIFQAFERGNGEVLLVGSRLTIGGQPFSTLILRGGQWEGVPGGLPNYQFSHVIVEEPNGRTNYFSANMRYVLENGRWNLSDSFAGTVRDAIATDDGQVVVFGSLTSVIPAGGAATAVNGLAILSGGVWRDGGAGIVGSPLSAAKLADGSILVLVAPAEGSPANATRVFRLNLQGQAEPWALEPQLAGSLLQIAAMPDGSVVLTGGFATVNGQPSSGVAVLRNGTWLTAPVGRATNEGPFTARIAVDQPSGRVLLSGSSSGAFETFGPLGSAVIRRQPSDVVVCGSREASLLVTTRSQAATAVRWQYQPATGGDFANLVDGENQLADGTRLRVVGASANLLTLKPIGASWGPVGGQFRAIIETAGRTLVSDAAAVEVVNQCFAADIGGQGGAELTCGDGVLDSNDFVVFLQWFFAGDMRADFAGQGAAPVIREPIGDGTLDNNDFVVFINLFFEGCGS